MVSSDVVRNEADTNVDLTHLGGENRLNHRVVRLDYDWEVIYWCLVLQCTKQDLEDAVGKVGNDSNAIRQLLKGN